jgi:hypothetical protein
VEETADVIILIEKAEDAFRILASQFEITESDGRSEAARDGQILFH